MELTMEALDARIGWTTHLNTQMGDPGVGEQASRPGQPPAATEQHNTDRRRTGVGDRTRAVEHGAQDLSGWWNSTRPGSERSGGSSHKWLRRELEIAPIATHAAKFCAGRMCRVLRS